MQLDGQLTYDLLTHLNSESKEVMALVNEGTPINVKMRGLGSLVRDEEGNLESAHTNTIITWDLSID